jgi:hypothetical protein
MFCIEYFSENSVKCPFADRNKLSRSEIYKVCEDSSPETLRCWISHAIPTAYAVTKVKEFLENSTTIVEIGAGKGLWAYLINHSNYLATDAYPPSSSYYPILKVEAASVFFSERVFDGLVLIWPPCTAMAAQALKQFQGSQLVYIGEELGGCTGDEEMFSILASNYELVRVVKIPTIYNHTDQVYLYHRCS